MLPHRDELLSGWGRYPVQRCRVFRPERRHELARALAPGGPSLIARGLGRAYGDAALNQQGVLSMLRMDRMLAWDESSALLEVEGGVSLGDVVAAFLPRGFFLPVTPGTRHVTVGGAIAADVHGKNHHRDGTFSRWVDSLRLLTPGGEERTCSPTLHPDLFWATAGGMGLTGVIVSARIRLVRVPSSAMLVQRSRAPGLEALLARLAEGDGEHRYTVAWVDALARGGKLGRGVVFRGDHAPAREEPASIPRRGGGIPIAPPVSLVGRATVAAFNRLYLATHADQGPRRVPIHRFFYPLDGVGAWNRLYGPRGFIQHQCVIPDEAGTAPVVRLLEEVSASGRGAFLAVLKRFGAAAPGPLSFPRQGITLALDLPVDAALPAFAARLNRLVRDAGGRVYLAKDATLDPDDFAAMYPRAAEFRALQRSLDPAGVLTSAMARRVGLRDD